VKRPQGAQITRLARFPICQMHDDFGKGTAILAGHGFSHAETETNLDGFSR
jgi:hypothetical protein